MRKIYFYAGIICFLLLPARRSAAQVIVGHGHETIKSEFNFTELANYLLAHPTPPVEKEPENDEDNDSRPPHPPVTDLSLIHYRLTPPSAPPHGAFAPPTLPISPAPTDTFESTLDNGTLIPPDTHGAVDSNYCITAVNSAVHIQKRVGTNVSSVSLDAFWTSVVSGGTFDPRIHYDPSINRWIFVTDAGAESASSALLIAVSKTSNPTGAWWTYSVATDATGVNWLDYPDVGFNGKWLVITGNLFANTGGAFNGAKVFVFNKANLVAGVGASYTSFIKPTSFTICPAITYDATETNLFMVESWDGTAAAGGQMQLWKIAGAIGAETMTSIGFPASAGFRWQGESNAVSGTGGADFVPQVGTANLIQANDDRVTQVIQMNNKLWFAHNVFLPYSTTVNPNRCSAQWWQIDTLGVPAQIGVVDDPSATNNNFYTFPTLTVNTSNDALVGFTVTSKLIHPSAAYTLHMHTDPVDSMRPVYTYRHGQTTYFKNFGSTRDRWGDYSGCVLDPLNQTDFWTIQEVSSTTTNTWDTWWAYVKICIPPVALITPAGPVTFCAPGNVVLNANTGTGLTYQWETGGAAIAGATNNNYTASVTGTYNVIVYNSTTCDSTSLPVIVSVNPQPAAITGATSFCQGTTDLLLDGTTGGTWSSGTTSVATVGTDGTVTGVSNGTSVISYTLATGCANSVTVTVNTSPAVITGTLNVCVGSTTTLSDASSPGTWTSGTLSVATVGSGTGIVSGVTAGVSVITFTATGGCYVTAAVTVSTAAGATITAVGSTTFCTGGSVALNANTGAGYTYQWQLGGGNIAGATSSSYTAAAGGNYTVIVYNGGCTSASAVTTVTVTSGPGATITPLGSTTFCPGGSVVLNANTGAGITYQWQLGGFNITGATLSSYTATTGGNYTVIVSQGTCVVTSAITVVTVDGPDAGTIGGAAAVCTGQTVTLTDAAIGGIWSSGSAAIATVNTTGMVTGIAAGTVTISYSVTNACGTAVAMHTITVNAATPVLPVTGPVSVCQGGTITLADATPLGSWSSGAPAIATVTATGVVTGVAPGTVNITYSVTNASGCTGTAMAAVTVYAPFTASITPLGITTFCTGGYVGLDATTGVGYTYQWQVGGANIPGATSASYTAYTGGNYTVIITGPGGCAATSAGVLVTVNLGTIVLPSVTINASLGLVLCTATAPETFTAVPVNGGTAPTYQWFVNGVAAGVGAAYTYSPSNGDIVSCKMASNAPCAFPDTATTSILMTISPLLTPSVSIIAVPNDTVCTGDSVMLVAVPVLGGTHPTYLWTENSINVATGPEYIYVPSDGDLLTVTMTTDYPCVTTNIVTSPLFTMHVDSPMVNTLTVFATRSSIVAGAIDTFIALAPNAGASPAFQWFLDGVAIPGANSYRYITSSLAFGDIISCQVTSSYICSEPRTIMSGGITVLVSPSGVAQVGGNGGSFTLIPNPNKGSFTITGKLSDVTDDRVNIRISNVLGQAVYKKLAHANNGVVDEHISLDNTLAAGIYLVTVTSGEDHIVFHVVIDK